MNSRAWRGHSTIFLKTQLPPAGSSLKALGQKVSTPSPAHRHISVVNRRRVVSQHREIHSLKSFNNFLGTLWKILACIHYLTFPTFTIFTLSLTFPAFIVSLFKHYCELGFGFGSSPVDDDCCLSDTLPALNLYYTVNKRYNNFLLSKTKPSSSDCDNTPYPIGSPHSSVFTTDK
ncbi:hypothetical protein Fmac_020801 [Flemingia macrophylla]|uniref:Uncharacterized protein n=1 Tax=Flemingia macrophylla TaxID=520843 RepID=A0ABD1LV30_9FABA